ncbi:glycogen debranching N-terminal domain-containing protein [Luethyella okanaganae]|uniref:Glycogen debranching N-terminal domain-containing protein n=1 Tax=Luethyella okanaganae TaxID=69372 RepID=A0ABW1VA48_9MICO
MAEMTSTRQPPLAALATVLNAPASAVSDPEGDTGVTPIEGYYLDDRRILSRVRLHVARRPMDHIATAYRGPQSVEFTSVVPGLATADADFGLDGDPQISVCRRRTLTRTGYHEKITLRSASRKSVSLPVALSLGTDGATISEARSGTTRPLVAPQLRNGMVTWLLDDASVAASFDPPATVEAGSDGLATAEWNVTLHARESVELTAEVTTAGALAAPANAVPSASLELEADPRLERLFERSVADAYALVRTDTDDPADRYMCAGAPWYLTLFGRDSIWAARMMLPFDLDLAVGTLRALARRQGVVHDPVSGEQPGKILHELRREEAAQLLPARYYGSADATSLWIILLTEAWRWGADPATVQELIPHLRAALQWLTSDADSDRDGLLDYRPDPAGLSHQGWKDSRDAVHDAVGAEHAGTVALVEMQAYAYQAAVEAADLLDALGQNGAPELREWAAQLRARFHTAFWVEDTSYPALAIVDRVHRADAISSNMGHLLGTGIVSAGETALIASYLGSGDLDSGFGLRTLSASSPRYNPISYHNGSVWPHDTAIAIRGLAETGFGEVAAQLADGIIAAGEAFEFRLPELWSGISTAGGPSGSVIRPLPYPTACSPQAWSAASVVAIITAALGLHADVPNGRIRIRPPRSPILGALTVKGIQLPTGQLDVHLDKKGDVTVLRAPEGVQIDTPSRQECAA